MENKTDFKPYIPADKVMPEFSVTAAVLGCLLAILFGAANAYLGLRVGMTVSASIPAAVISMGVIRIILKRIPFWRTTWYRPSVLQVESLAAGAIFTLPAIFMWAVEGKCDAPGIPFYRTDRTVRRNPGCTFHDPASSGTDCRRAWNPAVSGGNGMCRGTSGRRRGWRKIYRCVQRTWNCSSL